MGMNEITLQEIIDRCNSPEGKELKKKVRDFVRSENGFNPNRVRPRSKEKSLILDSFKHK